MLKKVLSLLYRLTNWIEFQLLKDDTENFKTTYNSLSPIDSADQDLHYTNALIWALKTRKENDIRNIALTGPYGSGKSSVLKTFQKRHSNSHLHFLNISLATFKEESIAKSDQPANGNKKNFIKSDSDDLLRLIELSILQQIFYHAQDDEIPDSRFKKIKSVNKWQIRCKSISIILFIISLSIIFQEQLPLYLLELTEHQSFYQFWALIVSILLLTAISYTILHLKKRSNKRKIHFSIPISLLIVNTLLLGYIAFIGLNRYGLIQFPNSYEHNFSILLRYLSLIYATCFIIRSVYLIVKHISRIGIHKLRFQDAEIEIDDRINKSILNHHLDEIIYFFEVTPYNVVIIEDLDRFRQTEIFTKLREINLLLNNSKKTRHKEITFIYAVRDDMFTDKERTKFFDFIIPIIPVINSSNSSQQLLKKKKKNDYLWSEDLIDSIALFIDDMRLLHNITNEFHLYKNKLTGNLSQDKLLSILVYKNIFPNDFSQLSNNEGMLFDAINSKRNYVDNELSKIDTEISLIQKEIKHLKEVKALDEKELRSLYVFVCLQHLPNFLSFKINEAVYTANQIINDDLFEYFQRDEITFKNFRKYNGAYYTIADDQPLPIKFNEVEKKVNEAKNYLTRIREIRDWHNDKIKNLQVQIQQLDSKKAIIRSSKIKDLLSDKSFKLRELKSEQSNTELKQQKLISVLLRNGYIAEDYLDYISIFYEGSITRPDYDFLLNVKSQIQSEFDYKLYKIDKLIKKINIFDFTQDFILNNDLLDFLLITPSYLKQRDAIFSKLKDESEVSIKFIENFVNNGTNTGEFIRILCKSWINIWSFLEASDITSETKARYFKDIIECAEVEDITQVANQSNFRIRIKENTSFLSITQNKTKLKQILDELKIHFEDLSFEDSADDLLDLVYEKGYYSVTAKILPKWIKKYGKFNQVTFDTANYHAILESESSKLIEKVNEQINEYVEDVYLQIDTNINEEEPALIKLLNNDDLDRKNKTAIIEKTTTKIRDLSSIKDKLIFCDLLASNKVIPTWKNLLTAYNELEGVSSEMLSFINMIDNARELANSKIPTDEAEGKSIYGEYWRALLQNDEISDESYELISKSSPWWYENLTIEDLSERKVTSLINNAAFNPTPKSLERLKEHFENLAIILIEKYPKKFIEQLEDLELDENDLCGILSSTKLTNAQKNKFVSSLSIDDITLNEGNLLLISNIVLEDNSFEINGLLKEKLLFFNGVPSRQRVRLFNKFKSVLSEERIEDFLTSLGKDYAKITNKKRKALIEDNEYNRQLLDILSGNIISSYSKEKKGLRVYHKRR